MCGFFGFILIFGEFLSQITVRIVILFYTKLLKKPSTVTQMCTRGTHKNQDSRIHSDHSIFHLIWPDTFSFYYLWCCGILVCRSLWPLRLTDLKKSFHIQHCGILGYLLHYLNKTPTMVFVTLKISLFSTVFYKIKRPAGGSDGKESSCSGGDWGLIPESGRSSREGNGYPL